MRRESLTQKDSGMNHHLLIQEAVQHVMAKEQEVLARGTTYRANMVTDFIQAGGSWEQAGGSSSSSSRPPARSGNGAGSGGGAGAGSKSGNGGAGAGEQGNAGAGGGGDDNRDNRNTGGGDRASPMTSTGGNSIPKKAVGATHQHDQYIIDFINKGFRALQPKHFSKHMRDHEMEGGSYTTDTRAYMELLDRLRIYDYEDSKHNHFPDLL